MTLYFLYGPTGSGKSTVGRLLAGQLDLPFFDLDELIEESVGTPISEIFTASGESAFRRREVSMLQELVGRESEAVIALGGGALLDPAALQLVQAAGVVVCLFADEKILLERIEKDTHIRPLVAKDPQDSLHAYLNARAEHYASFALQLDTTYLDLKSVMEQAQTLLGAFHITGMGDGYDVRVIPGGLDMLPGMIQKRGLKGPFCIVSDSNTRQYGQRLANSLEQHGERASVFQIEAGEVHKNAGTIEAIWAALVEAGLERGSTVIAAGGGVVGDLAGFAAASYLRGVSWVCVPTSLLAMVDAGLGGKTGADLPQGKNLIGAFHAPRFVMVDPDVLKTLPAREIRNGMAEVIKAAVIGDPDLFEVCRQGNFPENNQLHIPQAMAVKVKAIQADPYERGIRLHLNFGHTIGHAVEHVSGYRISHGAAVSIGMVAEARLAELIGIAEQGLGDEIQACLLENGLPVVIPEDLDRDLILAAMLKDKKKTAGSLRFALPEKIGKMLVLEVEKSLYAKVV